MPRPPDLLADWFVGGAGKRALLRVLVRAPPGQRFTQKELADAANLHEKGSAARHLRVLVQAGLLEREVDGRYRVRRWRLRQQLGQWLAALDAESTRSKDWTRPLPPSR